MVFTVNSKADECQLIDILLVSTSDIAESVDICRNQTE